MIIKEEELMEAISVWAKKYKLDPNLVRAIIHVESGAGIWKTRFEPETERYVLEPHLYAKKLGISIYTEQMAQMHSYGLMQIMGFVAREHGYDDYLSKLTWDWKKNLELGCIHLSRFKKRWPTFPDYVSAYNQGSPKKVGDQYKNADYVKKVLTRLDLYKRMS
jgi:soluble lytic murein transglycosylase-like protein